MCTTVTIYEEFKLDLEADLDDDEIVEITAPDIEITIHLVYACSTS